MVRRYRVVAFFTVLAKHTPEEGQVSGASEVGTRARWRDSIDAGAFGASTGRRQGGSRGAGWEG